MKKIKSLLVTSILILSIFVPNTSFAASDIEGHYAEADMQALIDLNIMKGFSDGTYRPNKTVTRAEFISLLMRSLDNYELVQFADPVAFSDVDKDDWFYDEFSLAGEIGILRGQPDGTAIPNQEITRQEMAALVLRAMKALGVTTAESELPFIDKDQIADWVIEDIQKLVSLQLINGIPDKNGNLLFAPLNKATRGETAVIVNRILNIAGAPTKEDPTDEDTTCDDSSGSTTDSTETTPCEDQPTEDPINEENVTLTQSNYSIALSNVVEMQANNRPKVDGAGRFIASKAGVEYYVNPANFTKGTPEFFQYLVLSYKDGLTAEELNNKFLNSKGSLAGTGETFIKAGLDNNVNVIYLIAHALHETSNGFSLLASGIDVGLNSSGVPQMVTDQNRSQLTAIKTTFNMFGIGAIDSNPNKAGAERAYREGWFSPQAAILGGAKFITNGYISSGQDTLYKMKWNPERPTYHQYATHIMWAVIQAQHIYDMYAKNNLLDHQLLHFDVPVYNNQSIPTPKPSSGELYGVDPKLKGSIGVTTDNLNFRIAPFDTRIDTLPTGTQFEVIGDNNGWYKITVNGQVGWVIDDYTKLNNLLQVVNIATSLNVRNAPDTGAIVGSLENNDKVAGVIDSQGNFVKSGDWYQIYYNGQLAWVHGDFITVVQ